MATIGEEVNGELISTNVTDSTDTFDNTLKMNYPSNIKFQDGDSIYQNTGDTIYVDNYDSDGSYVKGDIVYDNGLVKKVTATTGDVPKQPGEYTGVDTNFDSSTWTKRYMKIKDIPPGLTKGGISSNALHKTETPKGFFMKPDETKMYVLYNTKIRQYTINKTDNSLTITDDQTEISTQTSDIKAIYISSAGDKIYEVDNNSDKIHQTTLNSPWSLSDVSYIGDSTILPNPVGIEFNPDGSTLYILAASGADTLLRSFSLNTSWDISSKSTIATKTFSDKIYNKVKFGDGGDVAYLLNSADGELDEATFGVAYDVSSLTINSENLTISSHDIPSDLGWESDGGYAYILTGGDAKIRLYIANTPWTAYSLEYAVLPFRYSETRGGSLYEYYIGSWFYIVTTTKDGSKVKDKVLREDWLTQLDEDSIEKPAVLTSNGSWLPRTIIYKEGEGLYARTNVDAAIEYKTINDYQITPVNNVNEINGFNKIGYSNPYRPFDSANITPAIFASPMNYTVKGLESFNSFTLAKVLASYVIYSFTLPTGDPNYDLWLDGVEVASGGNGIVKTDRVNIDCRRDAGGILSKYPTTVIFYADHQMPIGSTVTISLTHDENVSLGDFPLNNSIAGGFTDMQFTHGIQDFNDYTPDAWGNIPESTKAIVTKFNITVDIYLENYDHCVSLNESIAGKYVTIDGSDSGGEAADSLSVFSSLIRRVRVTSATSKTIVKDGEIFRMAGFNIGVQEIV
ncbi:MAG: hypothetical protein ABXS91_10025 [Sulfurimonas sp.]